MYSNVDVGDREHGTNKKASWCGGVVVGGGRAGGCKEGPGAVGMWWLGIKWSSNRAPSSIAILYGKIGAPFQLRLNSIWNR